MKITKNKYRLHLNQWEVYLSKEEIDDIYLVAEDVLEKHSLLLLTGTNLLTDGELIDLYEKFKHSHAKSSIKEMTKVLQSFIQEHDIVIPSDRYMPSAI